MQHHHPVLCHARCCSGEHDGPTRNLLTSQFLTPAELKLLLQHCYHRGDRQGLMLAAILFLGMYNGFRWVVMHQAVHSCEAPHGAQSTEGIVRQLQSGAQLKRFVLPCRGGDMSMLTYGLLACSSLV